MVFLLSFTTEGDAGRGLSPIAEPAKSRRGSAVGQRDATYGHPTSDSSVVASRIQQYIERFPSSRAWLRHDETLFYLFGSKLRKLWNFITRGSGWQNVRTTKLNGSYICQRTKQSCWRTNKKKKSRKKRLLLVPMIKP